MEGKSLELSTSSLSRRDTVHLEAFTEFDKLPPWPSAMMVMASLEALCESNEERRSPVTLCAVIDRSGSMSPHLALVKDTLNFMVQQMRGDDKLCLIAFDHEVAVVLPLTEMTEAGKLQAEKAIEGVKARGHTNLSGGLLLALQLLYKIPAAEATAVESVLLFTDGKANYGITKQEALEKATRSVLAQIGRQVSVFTLGYGGEHDGEFLSGLAAAGNGLFYFVENADSIPESFCDCLGGLLSVAAQNLTVVLTSESDCHLEAPITPFKVRELKPGRKFEVTIPDIYCEEEKCILLRVSVPRLPPSEAEGEGFRQVNLMSITAEYFDVVNSEVKTHHVAAYVTQTKLCQEPLPAANRRRLLLQQFRTQVAQHMDQACKMADMGRYKDARDLLDVCLQQLKSSEVWDDPLVVYLAQTIKDSAAGMADKVTYSHKGKSTILNYKESHWQQRSNVLTPAVRDFYGAMEARDILESPTVPASPVGSLYSASRKPVLSKESAPYRGKKKTDLMAKHAARVRFSEQVAVHERSASLKPSDVAKGKEKVCSSP